MRKLAIKTVSKDFSDAFTGNPSKVRLFNFETGKREFDLTKDNDKNGVLGTLDSSWIRVYVDGNKYHDFVSSSLIYVATDKNVSLVCNDDIEHVTLEMIAVYIRETADKLGAQIMTSEQYLDAYYKMISKEMKMASVELQKLYSASSQESSSRLNVQDTFEHGKIKLEKKYLMNLIIRQITKENKNKIIDML